jgi:CheY-like chemotaxis protein
MSHNVHRPASATILVTEDEPVVRAFAGSVIEEAGHRVLDAASVGEALELLRSGQAVDVLFTDINLRPLDRGGVDLAIEATKLRPSIRVIYTTGRSLTNEMRVMFVNGSVFIPKPYTSQKLREVVGNILSR